MLENLCHVERSRIANKSHLLGVKPGDQSLEDLLPVSHHPTCRSLHESVRCASWRICLNLPVWLGSYCTRIKTDMGSGFLAVNLISNYEHQCALNVQGLADTLARYQQ